MTRDCEAPHGYDPLPFLEAINVPCLWLLDGQDRNIPCLRQDVTILSLLRVMYGMKMGAGYEGLQGSA